MPVNLFHLTLVAQSELLWQVLLFICSPVFVQLSKYCLAFAIAASVEAT